MKTLLLDVLRWDLCLDAAGNIAIADDPYAVAQDVASACRLFAGELWYDTTKGVPYFRDILGKWPPLSLVKNELNTAALTVPTVVTAQTFISQFVYREIYGQVQVVTSKAARVAVTMPLSIRLTGFTIAISGIGGEPPPPGIGISVMR